MKNCLKLLAVLLLSSVAVTAFNCTDEGKSRCRVEIEGNTCYFNGEVAQCDCGADGYTESERRTECKRTFCTEDEEHLCLTDFDNDCKIVNETYQCVCYGSFEANETHTECSRNKCSAFADSFCRIEIEGNTCAPIDDTIYECHCNATGYTPNHNGTRCVHLVTTTTWSYITRSYRCYEDEEESCKTKFKGNKCYVEDLTFNCSCNADGFFSSGQRCIQTECTSRQNKTCDPFEEGNSCEIVESGIYRCNCSAPSSIHVTWLEEERCRSSICRDIEDNYACKVEVEGNNCTINATYEEDVRQCTCNAPGYKLVTTSHKHRDNECWRVECTSYEEDECLTKLEGNSCEVISDVYKCTCNASGYEVEEPKQQRCIKLKNLTSE